MTHAINHKYIGVFSLVALLVFSACICPVSNLLHRATETPLPTATPAPTLTFTPSPLPPTPTPLPDTATPTATPFFTLTPQSVLLPAGATFTPIPTHTVPPDYLCDIYSQTPPNGSSFPPNADFDGRWVVKNTGNKTWTPDDIEFRYISGYKFQRESDVFLLTKDIKPGQTQNVLLDMRMPMEAGEYKALWAMVLERNGNIICAVQMTLYVR